MGTRIGLDWIGFWGWGGSRNTRLHRTALPLPLLHPIPSIHPLSMSFLHRHGLSKMRRGEGGWIWMGLVVTDGRSQVGSSVLSPSFSSLPGGSGRQGF